MSNCISKHDDDDIEESSPSLLPIIEPITIKDIFIEPLEKTMEMKHINNIRTIFHEEYTKKKQLINTSTVY